MSEGRIRKALSGFYYVDTGGEVLTCRARGKFRKEGVSPLVGDRVEVRELGNGEGVVEAILPRKNAFSRPAVANIDQLVVIASGAIPKTDPFLIDRVAAIAALKGCGVVVVLNKCDLDSADDLYAIYAAAGFPTLRVSAETGEGIEELKPLIAGKLSAFTGNSGVGKSSILNALDPEFQLQVGDVSQALGRGRHTTRHVELFRLKCGAEVVDSPGFSSFETEELNLELKEHLPETFVEFRPYLDRCRFTGCSHTKEKGCAVLEAVRAGKIQRSRHASYVRLYEELKPLQDWQERKKWNRAEEAGRCPPLLCALPFVPGQAAAYIMGVRKGRGAYVSERRRMLDPGNLRGGAGGRDPDCGDLSGGGADVPGGVSADRVRLRLLQALERSKYHANCSVEVPQSPQRHSAEAVQDFGIISPGRT